MNIKEILKETIKKTLEELNINTDKEISIEAKKEKINCWLTFPFLVYIFNVSPEFISYNVPSISNHIL